MRFLWKFCFCLSIGLAGCGKSSERIAFSGHVSAAGELVHGTIRFVPVSHGPMAMTTVNKGEYSFTSATGPIPGDYNVTIEQMPSSANKGAGATVVTPRKWTVSRRIEGVGSFDRDFLLGADASSQAARN